MIVLDADWSGHITEKMPDLVIDTLSVVSECDDGEGGDEDVRKVEKLGACRTLVVVAGVQDGDVESQVRYAGNCEQHEKQIGLGQSMCTCRTSRRESRSLRRSCLFFDQTVDFLVRQFAARGDASKKYLVQDRWTIVSGGDAEFINKSMAKVMLHSRCLGALPRLSGRWVTVSGNDAKFIKSRSRRRVKILFFLRITRNFGKCFV